MGGNVCGNMRHDMVGGGWAVGGGGWWVARRCEGLCVGWLGWVVWGRDGGGGVGVWR